MIKTKAYVNKEAYREAVKAFPDDCAKDSETVHLLRMGYQVCYEKHQKNINSDTLDKLASEYAINELVKFSSFTEIEIAENVLLNNEITKAFKAGYRKAKG